MPARANRKPSLRRLNELTAVETVRAIAAGETSCEAVVRASLDRIAEREAQVFAWQYLEDPERLLERARVIDRGGSLGPLHGVPFGIKDIIDTHDMPTEYGSPIYAGHQPASDAACVALSRKAGAILLGKTVTTEFANTFPGKTRHPFDPSRTPGGSSSGSAAAVADCMVPLAIGTQTTGSTIRPAAFCGVFGYRPTYGDLRCAGVKEAAGSLDTLGLLARSIEDIALYRDVLLGVPPEPIADDPAPPRIGFCRTHLWDSVAPYAQEALETAARRLSGAGAQVVDVTLPAGYPDLIDAHRAISSFEFARNFTWEIEAHGEEISERLRNGRIRNGLACSLERYREARAFAETCRLEFADACGDCDVLITAPAAGEAPIGLASTGDAAYCAMWTTLHVPAVTMPVSRGPNGLPLGAQFVARRNDDRRLFAAVRWAERALS